MEKSVDRRKSSFVRATELWENDATQRRRESDQLSPEAEANLRRALEWSPHEEKQLRAA